MLTGLVQTIRKRKSRELFIDLYHRVKVWKGNTMSEFTHITSQEDFDSMIKERLERNTKSVTADVEKKFEGYISPDDFKSKTADLESKIAELNGKIKSDSDIISDLTAKNKAYENSSVKMRTAYAYGIPFEMAERLKGDTEDDIKKDAENLAKYVSSRKTPDFNGDSMKNSKAKYSSLLNSLKGEI